MSNPAAKASRFSKAANDDDAWRIVAVESRNMGRFTVRIDRARGYLTLKSQPLEPIPDRVGFSERYELIAVPSERGPIIMIDTERTLGRLGDRLVFLEVDRDDPTSDEECRRCGYPVGYEGDALCQGHQDQHLGQIYRSSSFARSKEVADAAAFTGNRTRLANAITELAPKAYPLQARRLLEKYTPLLDGPDSPELALALAKLAHKAGDHDRADALIRELGDGPFVLPSTGDAV